MTHPEARGAGQGFEPRWPTIAALGFLTLWIAILSLPMWTGQFLAGPWSDQYATGYAFRHWMAEQWRSLGHVPLWNPDIFGGLPFVAAQHGDIFYPTAWLRLLLPTSVAMNLGFAAHYVMAGFFMYLLLRLIGVSWTSGVVGGVAYQLSGVVVSLVSPGHDGKLYVTALLPLALIGVFLGLRRRRLEGHALLALTVGLALLSPHYQMVYYMLIVAGVFALYLTVGEPDDRPVRDQALGLALALGAVVVGFGIAMIQVLPFYHYLPFSPRAEGYYGFAASASFGIPWEHVPEFFLAGFAGDRSSYWGSNFGKLHSEYLGLPVVALAVFGAMGRRRRLVYWLAGVGLLVLLVALSSSTPFYRLWWSVMPFVKQTRAPGMVFYVVAFVVAALAAFGVERLERGEGRRHAKMWVAVGTGVAVIALVGAFGGFAEMLATGLNAARGETVTTARAAAASIRLGALLTGLALAAVGGLAWARLARRIPLAVFCLGLAALIGLDLWRNGREFWVFSRVQEELFGGDPVTERMSATREPYRVLDFKNFGPDVYPGSALMAFRVPQVLGHHGNELHRFDQLLGGKNVWANLARSLKLWDLLAVRYVLLPARPSDGTDSIPGYARVLTGVPTSAGTSADLYERVTPAPYARVVPAALRVPDEQAIATMLDPRFDLDRVVLVAPDAAVEPAPITSMPDPLSVSVSFEEWQAGLMKIRIAPAAPQSAYLVVSENWYPDWKATVDGVETPVVRGNVSLITVPVPEGAETVELSFESADYRRGKTVSFLSLGLVMLGLIVPSVMRKRASV